MHVHEAGLYRGYPIAPAYALCIGMSPAELFARHKISVDTAA
jgi:hypothetical protein